MFTNICNIYLWQSVGRLLKLEPAQAKKSELAWLISAQWQILNSSQARLRLESKLDIWAEPGLGSEGSGISELASAQTQAWAQNQNRKMLICLEVFSLNRLVRAGWLSVVLFTHYSLGHLCNHLLREKVLIPIWYTTMTLISRQR